MTEISTDELLEKYQESLSNDLMASAQHRENFFSEVDKRHKEEMANLYNHINNNEDGSLYLYVSPDSDTDEWCRIDIEKSIIEAAKDNEEFAINIKKRLKDMLNTVSGLIKG